MALSDRTPSHPPSPDSKDDRLETRLDSWKAIASWLNRSEKTVRRWEGTEGLPIHRLLHEKGSSVYAYPSELRAWWEARRLRDATEVQPPDQKVDAPKPKPVTGKTAGLEDPDIHKSPLSINHEIQSLTAEEPMLQPRTHPSQRRTVVLIVSILIVAVGLTVVIASGTFRNSTLHRSSSVSVHSLAVLPLENLSRDPEQEYFADGMTAELITELAKISSLRVISRTSVMQYKGVRKPLAQIARELKVDAVVEGEVLRSNGHVRVTAQLIDTAGDRHLWAETYDRDLRDVLALQGDIAQSIANAIRARVTPAELTHLATDRRIDPETFEIYLKARYFLEKRSSEGILKAEQYFQQAIRKDPQYAAAYAGLAKTYRLLGAYELLPPRESYPNAREAADKALQLDDTLSEAYTVRALSTSFYEHDWNSAEKDFQRAITINSNDALAHHWYAEHLMAIGQLDRAIAELKRARELDPLSLTINSVIGVAYFVARRYPESMDQCRRTLDLDPDFPLAHWCLGVSNVSTRHFSQAITEMERANAVGATPVYASGLGYAYAAAGDGIKARAIIEALKQRASKGYLPAYLIASIYGELGEKDRAFDWLQRAYDERDPELTYLFVDPIMDPLRSDSRFNALVGKFRFPQ